MKDVKSSTVQESLSCNKSPQKCYSAPDLEIMNITPEGLLCQSVVPTDTEPGGDLF